MSKKEIVLLNGTRNGFMCYLKTIKRNLLYKDSELFSNLDILKNVLAYKKISYKDYHIIVSFTDKRGKRHNFSMNEITDCNGIYIVYDKKTDTLFEIRPAKSSIIMSAGYFTIEKGDTEIISDHTIGVPKLKKLREALYGTINEFVRYPKCDFILEEAKWRKYVLKFKNSSTRIIFLDRALMFEENTNRKAEGKKALPFMKNYDRYQSMYCFVIQEKNENNRVAFEASAVLENILAEVRKNYPELDARIDYINLSNSIEY